ncbi:class I SAM-dependent RNA methyltransferase [Litoreibacter arenae]|uniref:23S rRNA (Uracil-5-)-methyltransferase RumA n=1 Tax=Litoreibacter arenae DSM 19593 TaxID=1123360 RepID=S9RHB3_9RHOB|nr:class I SAM-dependent RNA methyltransferase [Litoreibacter arenae]EPX77475.1 23S rRNA (Uracil-5-) -methyltransferase RumA [Litoreibacter arenae DSM 19593]
MTQTILRLNHKGEGVPETGAPIPRVLPDEVVEDGRIVTPSVARVAAPCRHYKSCGGCAMQHASDDFVAAWKTDVIRLGLSARGVETEIRPILTSPAQSRRRATLHGRRTKKGAMVGFFGRGSDALIDVPDCKLLHPALIAAFPVLEELTVAAASRKSTVGLVVTLSEAGLDIDIRDAKPLEPQGILEMAALAERHKLARLSWDGEAVATREPPVQSFGKARVAPPPGAFLQATAHGQAALLACVQDALGDAKQVVDLFAGCGTFSLPAAEKAEVWALEGEAALIDALDTGWRKAVGLKKVKAEVRDLFRRPLLPQELRKTDAVIIDPPRAGAEAQSVELAQSGVKRIAAVSCNPISFARDAEILIAGGYRLDWVQPVDQFRWSSHVELAAQFTKPHMG